MVTLYSYDGSPRSQVATSIIKYFKLDIEIKSVTIDEFHALNFENKKTPYLVGEKGFKLSESIAIIDYLLSLVPEEEKKGLLGKSVQDYVSILKWNSLINQDFLSSSFGNILCLFGKIPYNKKFVDTCAENIDVLASLFESRLAEYTYLVGERVTIADIFCVLNFNTAFKYILDLEWAAAHPNITRWFKTITQHPMLVAEFGAAFITDKKLVYQPPKKEKAPAKEQAPKAAAAAAPKPAAEEEKPAEEKKPKHPLELLGKPKMVLDEWKRVYSNEETRETALPWFWEHYDPSEWSLYKVGYKYNDELTLTFMSNNLVGGFFNRLSASTKYLFGCLVVYGENNNNGIVGAFLVRGQDFAPAFDVAPDWESYEYAKLDPTKEEDKEFVNNMWAWDKPVQVGSEQREIADGKVFK